MNRNVLLAYGIFAYVLFLGSLVYAVGFVGDFLVPKTIDSGPVVPPVTAIFIDVVLLGVFAIQHSVMARPFFKRWWTTMVPPAAERSTYVLASSLLLYLLFWQWRPLPGVIWNVTQPAPAAMLWVLFGLGWGIVLISTFLLNHFDLFGLRQVYVHAAGRPYEPIPFRTPGLYRFVRHPIMVGFLIAFWATPSMSQGHLLFTATVTAYVLIALQFEERDLVRGLGRPYIEYQREVPMLLPLGSRGSAARDNQST